MESNDGLIEALRTKEQTLGLSEVRFARQLGISRAAWRLLKAGEMQAGLEVLRAIVAAFPELWPQVSAYLSPENDSMLSSTDRAATEVPL